MKIVLIDIFSIPNSGALFLADTLIFYPEIIIVLRIKLILFCLTYIIFKMF